MYCTVSRDSVCVLHSLERQRVCVLHSVEWHIFKYFIIIVIYLRIIYLCICWLMKLVVDIAGGKEAEGI